MLVSPKAGGTVVAGRDNVNGGGDFICGASCSPWCDDLRNRAPFPKRTIFWERLHLKPTTNGHEWSRLRKAPPRGSEKALTTDFTDSTDGFQRKILSSVPSMLSVVLPLPHPGISQRTRIGFLENDRGKTSRVFDPFVVQMEALPIFPPAPRSRARCGGRG